MSQGKPPGRIARNGAQGRARRIAELHLKLLGKAALLDRVFVRFVTPLSGPDGSIGRFYEVKLSSADAPDRGYMIVSVSTDYAPVRCMAFAGPTPREQLQRLTGQAQAHIVLFTPLYLVAEDGKGGLLAELGHRPTIGFKGKGYGAFKRAFIQREAKVRLKKRPLVRKAWDLIVRGAAKSGGPASDTQGYELLDDEALPDVEFDRMMVMHPLRVPRYQQIPGGRGANAAHDFATGCTACAWLCLMGYYDNTTVPDLLRGSHMGLDIYSCDDYPSREMVRLSEHLRTRDSDGDGAVAWEDIARGFDYIKEVLGNAVTGPSHSTDGAMPALEVVYGGLARHKSPAVVAVEDHALLAYGGYFGVDPDQGQHHYLKVYTGWGGRGWYPQGDHYGYNAWMDYEGDPFLPYEELEGAWTLADIEPRAEVVIDRPALHAPASGDLGGRLVLACRLADQTIGILHSDDGYDFVLQAVLPATGTTPPALAVMADGKYVLVCWAQADQTLRLVQMTGRGGASVSLPAPPLIGHASSPAMTICRDTVYVVWGNDLVFTPVEALVRSAHPWPRACGGPMADAYWTSLGSVQFFAPPSLVSDPEFLYLGSVDAGGHGFVMMLDRHGSIIRYYDPGWRRLVERYPGGANLCSMRWHNTDYNVPIQTLWGSTNGPIDALRLVRETLYGQTGQILGEKVWLQPRENLWPKGIPSQEVISGSGGGIVGIRPSRAVLGSYNAIDFGPCLFSSWLDGNGKIHIRYHSADHTEGRAWGMWAPLDYAGWPH